MQPKAPATAPKQAPTPAALKQRAAQAPKAATVPATPAVKLTPAEQAQKAAADAEQKRLEQEKIVAINDEWKGKLSDGEKAEVLDVAGRNGKGLVVDGVIQPCAKKQKPKNLNCVPAVPSLNSGVSAEAKAAVKKAQEEKRKASKMQDLIDYGKVADWEGGSYSRGYVPWGPKLLAVTKDIGEKGSPHSVTMLVPDTAHNTARGQKTPSMTGMKGNNSGVTIGAGVDLGAKDEKEYRASLKKSATSSGLMTDAEADQLADKLKPYYGLKRTEACQALRKTPLDLSQKEVDLLNYESFMTHTDNSIRQYQQATSKDWGDLSAEEQTLLFSQEYHHGHMAAGLASDVGSYEPDKVLKTLGKEREAGYMKAYYDNQTAIGSADAKAYAARQAAQAAAKAAAPDSVKAGGH